MADIKSQLPVAIASITDTVAIISSRLAVDASGTTIPISGTVATNGDGSVTGGTAGSKSLLSGMVYNTAAPAPTNGQQLALQSDSVGNLKVAGTLTTTPSGTQAVSGTVTTVPSGTQTITGTVATNADATTTAGTAPTKALLGAIVYNTTVPTLTNGQSIALQSDVNGNLKIAGSLTTSPSGTQAVSGTVTTVPSGTQTITGTVATNGDGSVTGGTAGSKSLLGGMVYNTAAPTPTNGQQVALQSDSAGNLKVAGSLTTTPSGTQAVSGTVTTVPSGTQTVTGTVAVNAASGTFAVAGSVTVVPETTGVVTYYATMSTIAAASTGTASYTVTAAKTLYWKGIIATSSAGACKVIVDYGAGPTVVCIGFYSSASPFLAITFPQPLIIVAGTVVNVKIENNNDTAQNLYATIFGVEH